MSFGSDSELYPIVMALLRLLVQLVRREPATSPTTEENFPNLYEISRVWNDFSGLQ